MKFQNISKNNLTDIVFENRFKQYGAYFLRKNYDSRLITAFVCGLSIMLLLVSSPLIAGMFKGNEAPDDPFKKKLWTEREIHLQKKEEKVLESEEKKKVQKKIDVPKEHVKTTPDKGVNFNVKPTDKDSVIKDNLVQDGSQKTGSPDGDTTNTGKGFFVVQDTTGEEDDKNKVHTVVQVMPKPPYDHVKWLANNYKIPQCVFEIGLQGTVYVEFVVDENGNISDVVKKNDIGCGCGDKAVETVKKMPPWEPGKQGGKAVKVRFTVPIKIKLGKR
jgi:periplasmic protein TonB